MKCERSSDGPDTVVDPVRKLCFVLLTCLFLLGQHFATYLLFVSFSFLNFRDF